MNNEGRHRILARGVQWVGAVVAASVLLFGLFSVARVGHLFWVYHQVTGWATTNLGADSSAAMFVGVLGTAALILLLPSVLWYALSGSRVREAAAIAVGVAATVALLVNTVGRDVCFDRASGRPLCYVAETPDGLQFSRTPGVDPKYGILFVEYTSEMAQARGIAERETMNASNSPQGESSAAVVTNLGDEFVVKVSGDWSKVYRFPGGGWVDIRAMRADAEYAIRTQTGVYEFRPGQHPTIPGIIVEASFRALGQNPEEVWVRVRRN